MTKRTKIIVGLVGGLALLGGILWVRVPRISTATEAEVRAHVAPELLLPLPHIEGGLQRYEAARQALRELFGEWGRGRTAAARGAPLDLQNPLVQSVVDILEAGPLDRAGKVPGNASEFITFGRGLTAAALAAARQGDWEQARQQMEAAWLLLDRLTESDIVLIHPRYTMAVEANVYKAVLELAARRELPATLAGRWSVLLAVERHSQEQVQRILRGEFQLQALRLVPQFMSGDSASEMPWLGRGTYDPIETATLISDKLVETGRNAGLPVSQWSSAAAERIKQLATGVRPQSTSRLPYAVQALLHEIRGRNTLGRQLAGFYYTGTIQRIPEARTRCEQVGAALAVARFRQQKGRDPRSFDELIAAGVLHAAPRDHAKELPLAFDLKALFEWPAPASRPARGRG